MVLVKGEKIHVVHRRRFEKDIRKHFVGEIVDYDSGLVRVIGHVFVIEDPKDNVFVKKPEKRTRIIALNTGDLFVNVIPSSVDVERVYYESQGRSLRVTDGSGWYLDIKEFGWA